MDLKLETLKNRIMREEANLGLAKENNRKLDNAQEKYAEIRECYDILMDKLQSLKMTKMYATLSMNKYRQRVIAILEAEITNCLKLSFPEENYVARIEWNNTGGEPTAVLYLEKELPDGSRDPMIPDLQNGGLAQQIIRFAAVSGILLMLGSSAIYIDEGFNGGDGKSLAELSPLFIGLIDRGFQMIGIEHSNKIFSMLPRKEYNLLKNRLAGEVVVESVQEYDNSISNIKEILNNSIDVYKGVVDSVVSVVNEVSNGLDSLDSTQSDGGVQSIEPVHKGLDLFEELS